MSAGSGFRKKLFQQSIGETEAHSTVYAARAKPRNRATDAMWENQWPSSRRRRGKRGTPTEGFARHAWKKASGRAPSATYLLRIWSSVLGYVADRPANKTAPRSATDASSPTPCGVQPHGRGSGSKHVDALRDSVRSWRRSAQKSRPSSKNGKATMPHLPPGIPVPGHDTSDGKRAKLQNCKDAPETETSATAADRRRTGAGPSQDETRKDAPNGCSNTNVSWTEYICPYCQASVQSTVRNGKVQVAGHCSKQFRVRHGSVVRSHTHTCPTCGTAVPSSCARGRIRVKHNRPNGKACPTTVWHVKWKGPDTLLLEPTKTKTEKKLPPARKAFAQHKTWGPDNDSVPKLRKRPSCLEQGKPLRNLRLRSLWKTSAQRKKAASEKLQPPGKA